METQMPKMKTKSGAKKRFKVTAKGKVKFKQAHARHRLISKPKKMKRKARGTSVMFHSDGVKVLNYFLPYSLKKRFKNKKTRQANDNASAKAGA
jgi:large subunit ribosomal protein L35